MTSIERTVYRRMKRSYATKELIEAYTPTDEERRFVNTMTRAAQNQLNLMLWIKRFPCLGYFPSLDEIPTPLVTHLRQALDLAANAIPGYTGFPYVLFCAYLGFRSHAFEQFLEVSSFARRTRESYAEDLAPLLADIGQKHATALTDADLQAFLASQESLAPATYNRRLAALRSFTRWLRDQGWVTEVLLDDMKRKPEGKRVARALDAHKVESVLRKIADPRDRALFWLIYDGGLRSQEALSIDIEDISWPDRSILLHGKADRPREMFFSRAVGTLLDKYLATRGSPASGPLFVTHRKARLPRRADLDADGYACLSYRQADTLWKGYTPDWDLHQLRHTAISVRAAHDYTEVDLKRFSGHTSLRSLERYIADNREAAKCKAREWERRQR